MQTNSSFTPPVPDSVKPAFPSSNLNTPNSNPLPVINIDSKKENTPRKNIFMPILLVFIFILFAASLGLYFFYVLPKMNMYKYLTSINSLTSFFKISSKSVKASMDKIYLITTQEVNPNQNTPLESSGLLIHPEIAQLSINSNILGISTIRNPALVEITTNYFSQNLKGSSNLFETNSQVKGINTAAEDISIQKMRTLKSNSANANDYINKASGDLTNLKEVTNSDNLNLSQNIISETQNVNSVSSQFLSEAKKVADYYAKISDVLITTNTKINSFKVSLLSAATVISKLDPNTDSIASMKSGLTQVQIFMDQAKKDTDEIKSDSQALKNLPQSSLPKGIDKYHQHNIKVFEAITDFFTSSSNIMQGFITSTNSILTKTENNQLFPTDLSIYQGILKEGAITTDKAETKFVSDLQYLLGEETPLTLSFWQDNGLLSNAGKMEIAVDNLEKNIDKEIEKNKIPFLGRLH